MKARKSSIIKYLLMVFFIGMTCLTPGNRTYAKTTTKSSGVLTLSESRHVVKKGKRFRLKASILKKQFKEKKILWSSNNKKVAAVSRKGTVKAKRNGTAIITARIKGTSYTAKCKVIVGRPVKRISLPVKNLKLEVGHSFYLKPTIYPKKASVKKVSYVSSDRTVATVSKDGRILARRPGTIQVKVTSLDGNKASAKITVTVYDQASGSDHSNAASDVTESDSDQGNTGNDTNSGDIGDESGKESSEDGSDQSTTDSGSGQEDQLISENVSKFMKLLEKYSAFIKEYGEYFYKSATATVNSYEEAYKNVTQGKTAGINCASPINWALKEMGLNPSGQIYGNASGFVIKGTETKSLLADAASFLNDSPAIGLSVQQASDENYLRYGDILAMVIDGSRAHTLVYIGQTEEGYAMVYEAGNIPYGLGYSMYGCGPLDYHEKDNYIITGVMRLK